MRRWIKPVHASDVNPLTFDLNLWFNGKIKFHIRERARERKREISGRETSDVSSSYGPIENDFQRAHDL